MDRLPFCFRWRPDKESLFIFIKLINKGALDAEGIRGAICEKTPVLHGHAQHNTFVRVLRLDAKDTEKLQRILHDVFNNHAMIVVVQEPLPASNTAVYALVETLRGCSSLHFIDDP